MPREYTNLFAKLGITQEEIDKKIENVFQTIFFDPLERFYFETDNGMGYMLDTGNIDARTEGMSYGMMMAVQMDRKDIFDRLWLFSKTYMYQKDGIYKGYFAWSVKPDGTHNAEGPAPDGEEYFAMALFFAGARWGDGEEPFNYTQQARDILRHCLHQDTLVKGGRAMWDPENGYIRFVPEADYSDPSYHLPHFYQLFAERADEEDREFWKKAAAASRRYIVKSCHPKTGMASEYAEYDGTPKLLFRKKMQFYSDAYRVAMNIGLDASWFGGSPETAAIIQNLQAFFRENVQGEQYMSYNIDGTVLDEPAMHPVAITATLAAGSLAAPEGKYAESWLRQFWELPLRIGNRRYYDNCLYFFSLLMLSGRYHIFE